MRYGRKRSPSQRGGLGGFLDQLGIEVAGILLALRQPGLLGQRCRAATAASRRRRAAAEDAPFAGHGVAERLEVALGVGDGFVGVGEDDTAGAHGGRDDAGPHDAVAHGAGRLVARPTDHGRAGLEAREFGHRLGDGAGHVGRLIEPWHEVGVDVELLEQALVPGALADIQQERAGGVADLAGEFTRELEANVVFGQEDFVGFRVGLGVVLADPRILGR